MRNAWAFPPRRYFQLPHRYFQNLAAIFKSEPQGHRNTIILSLRDNAPGLLPGSPSGTVSPLAA